MFSGRLCSLHLVQKIEHSLHHNFPFKMLLNSSPYSKSETKKKKQKMNFPFFLLFFSSFCLCLSSFVLKDENSNNSIYLKCFSFFSSVPTGQLIQTKSCDVRRLFLRALVQNWRQIEKCCFKLTFLVPYMS